MSYAHMDHAAWVERSIAASKRNHKPGGGRLRSAAPKLGWRAGPDMLSSFQAKAFDILGMTFNGIYNAPIAWDSVDWNWAGGLSVVLRRGQTVASYDFNELAMLVFLCHEARIRVEIRAGGFQSLRLCFTPRRASPDSMTGHANLDEAVARFRDYLPTDHRILYREAPAEAPALGTAA